MKYYMGIDMGGTMVKAAIFSQFGEEIAVSEQKLKVIYPGKEMVERDVYEAKKAVYHVIKMVIQKSQIESSAIGGIGVTGQANGMYLFDQNGNPVRNAVLSSDTRAKKYVKKWNENGTWKSILPKIRQQIWAGNVPALLAWFQDHEPESLEKASVVVTAKDYIRYLLTGEFALEITEASGIASMDQEKKQITEEIYRELGIEKWLDLFPKRILECTEIAGSVTPECAKLTGLKEGTPVVGGQMDTGACIISTGVTEENQLGIIVGTWGINSIVKKKPVTDENIFMVYKYCIPEMYCVMEGSSTSATNLEWFIDTFVKDYGLENVYGFCNKLVEEADYNDTLFFLPFLYGSNVGPDAKSAFIGLEARHRKKEMLRAIYEGVAFCHKYHIERLRKYIEKLDVVRMAGGAARSSVWMQLFADVLGVPVEISKASELGAMGVAMEAAVGTGLYPDIKSAVSDWVKIKAIYQPNPEKVKFYEKKYQVYKKIIYQLDSIWGELDGLEEK